MTNKFEDPDKIKEINEAVAIGFGLGVVASIVVIVFIFIGRMVCLTY